MSIIVENALPRHRLTVEDFHRMGEAGILREDDRVELIEGEIVDMAPIGSKHAGTVGFLTKRLERATGEHALVFVQNPVLLGTNNEPQPDIALLKPREDFYRTALPRPEDVLLIIEVADTTLAYDRDIKVPLYARHGIPEVWLVDLENSRLHIFTSPAQDNYLECRMLAKPGIIALGTLPHCPVDLSGLFP